MMNLLTVSGSEVPGISTMILSFPWVRMDGSVRPNWSILFRNTSSVVFILSSRCELERVVLLVCSKEA